MIKLSTIKKEQPTSKVIYYDLNCDLGEGLGIYRDNKEEEIANFVSSVNIPCGLHSSDPLKIMNAIQTAKEKKLSIGAHIGYPDLTGFGYRSMNFSYEEIQAIIVYQIGALKALASTYKIQVEFVRPHGALYKDMAKDASLAVSVAKAIESIDPWLILVGAAGETLNKTREETNVRIAPEVHIDKKYDKNGDILFDELSITDPEECLKRAKAIIFDNKIEAEDGTLHSINFKTIHFSSSNENSIKIASDIRSLFEEPPVPIAISLIGENAIQNYD